MLAENHCVQVDVVAMQLYIMEILLNHHRRRGKEQSFESTLDISFSHYP